jgi:hypothetical protein
VIYYPVPEETSQTLSREGILQMEILKAGNEKIQGNMQNKWQVVEICYPTDVGNENKESSQFPSQTPKMNGIF